MECVYALVDYGCHEDYNFMLIKINQKDKEKFKDFCKDIKGWGYNNSLDILGWVNDIQLEYKDSIDIIAIQSFQNGIKRDLQQLYEMKEHHYLYGKEDKFIKLLKYEFLEVKQND